MADATSAASQVKKAAADTAKLDLRADAEAKKTVVPEGHSVVRLLRPLVIKGSPALKPGVHTLRDDLVPKSAKILAKGPSGAKEK